MTSVLITTSRRTCNRVRSFVSDLAVAFPDSTRFNRGSMNLAELAGRIRASGANVALVVTTYKGNPGEIQVYDSDGNRTHVIRIDGMVLRRDVAPSYKSRIKAIHELRAKNDSSHQTSSLAELVASWVNQDVIEADSALPVGVSSKGEAIYWFEDLPAGETLWTLHDAASGIEVGPRIRIDQIKT
ncbi:MAG: hypothetical protein ACOC3C_01165 [Candidatus Thorarchaeota archaeon]